jgi:hypothetical protein
MQTRPSSSNSAVSKMPTYYSDIPSTYHHVFEPIYMEYAERATGRPIPSSQPFRELRYLPQKCPAVLYVARQEGALPPRRWACTHCSSPGQEGGMRLGTIELTGSRSKRLYSTLLILRNHTDDC